MAKVERHNIQKLYFDKHGTVRFQENQIVQFLLDAGPFDLNMLARMDFDDSEYEHFAQLIGYSLGGFSELSYVSDETYEEAESAASLLTEEPK